MTDAQTVRQEIQVRTGIRSMFTLTLTIFSRMGQLERKSGTRFCFGGRRMLNVERNYSWECFFA